MSDPLGNVRAQLADAGVRYDVIVCPRCPELAPIIVQGGKIACQPVPLTLWRAAPLVLIGVLFALLVLSILRTAGWRR